MTKEQMERALAINSYREALELELQNWNECAGDSIVSPLAFRLGGDINYMNEEAFKQFRAANISWLESKIAELDSEFASL